MSTNASAEGRAALDWPAKESVERAVSGPLVFLDLAFGRGAPLGAALQAVTSVADQLHYQPDGQATPLGYWRPELVGAAVAARPPSAQSRAFLVAGPFSARVLGVMPPTRLVVAMVRDPVARILDGYAHTAPEVVAAARPAWPLDINMSDHQTRALSGDDVLDPDAVAPGTAPPAIDERDFARILDEASHRFVLIGVAERMEDSLLALVRQLGLPLAAAAGPWLDDPPPPLDATAEQIAELRALNCFDTRLHAAANARLDALLADDPAGVARDRALLARLSAARRDGATADELAAMESAERPAEPARLAYPPLRREGRAATPGSAEAVRALYLDLVEDVLVNRIYADASAAPWSLGRFDPLQRDIGSDWPSRAHSMIGRRRMRNVREISERVLLEGVPGDFIETGVWRGGATIMMRAVLAAYGDAGRTVYVADSFEGVPPPDPASYPADAGDVHFEASQLAVSQAEVAENFRRYGLLDGQVRFLPGWFRDTLPSAPIERLALMRLDGDLYESTMDALTALYDRLSPGGFVVVDDYGAVPGCKAAIEDFRAARGIAAPLEAVDWSGVYWRKA
jgi:O-methyltransferase